MDGREVEIRIAEQDALAAEVDVLVLKHAQESLGLDAFAKERLGLDLKLNLPPGQERIVPGRPAVGAETVVFLGVPRISDFGYSEIRHFARRAMSLVAAERPAAREVGITLHGIGFGLDEGACFEAEVSGLLDAIAAGAISGSLERVSILETKPNRARRLSERLARLLPGGSVVVSVPSVGDVAARLPGMSPTASEEKDHAFVAMPFAEDFEDVFYYGIEASLHKHGLLCERIDKVAFTGNVHERMKEKIRTATLVVADLTDANPNVYLEVGFAWAAEVPTLLIRRADSELKFDVQSDKCLSYRNIKDLEEKLTKELRQLLG